MHVAEFLVVRLPILGGVFAGDICRNPKARAAEAVQDRTPINNKK